MDLLFRLKEEGSLPAVSGQLGKRVRTNAESLIGVRVPHCPEDLSKGVAIGSGIYIDEHTHIEATRYPSGSDSLGLLATPLAGGRPGWNRILTWMGVLARSLLRHPLHTVRCLHPFGWARESLVLLCMQSTESHIEMRSARPWYWPFRRSKATLKCARPVRGTGPSADRSTAGADASPHSFPKPMTSHSGPLG
jgi:cholesterol oxidase